MTRRDWFRRLVALVTGAAATRSLPVSAGDLAWEDARPIQPLNAGEVARLFDVPVDAIDYNVMTYSEARSLAELRMVEFLDRDNRLLFGGVRVARSVAPT